MRRWSLILATLVGLATVGLLAVPQAGAAGHGKIHSKLWVSNSAPLAVAPGTSCAHPGYSTIQSAINVAGNFGATIEVCAGTYTEQLTMTQSVALKGSGAVTVKLPASPVNSTTSCDNAIGAASPFQQPQDAISICGASVSITGITVSAFWPAGMCYDSLYGVLVGAGGNLTANGLTVNGAGVPIGDSAVGCQGGVAIQVGSARPAINEAGTATLKNTVVSGYQKNGITTTGTGSVLTVDGASVTGRGPVGTAENGIEVAYGAKGTITHANVSANICLLPGTCGPNGLTQTEATGVLFYGAATGSSLQSSAISGNDIGVYYGSTSPTEPGSPEVAITKNTFTSNPDEQIQLDQGVATVNDNKLKGSGNVGIEVLQYGVPNGQSYAPASTATKDTISGQGVGVEVLSDNAVSGDFPGTFTISASKFLTGNTVATQDNSTNYTIHQVGDR